MNKFYFLFLLLISISAAYSQAIDDKLRESQPQLEPTELIRLVEPVDFIVKERVARSNNQTKSFDYEALNTFMPKSYHIKTLNVGSDGSTRTAAAAIPLSSMNGFTTKQKSKIYLDKTLNHLELNKTSEEFKMIRASREQDMEHYYFQQVKNDIPIYGSEIQVHTNTSENEIYFIHNESISIEQSLPSKATMDESQALKLAYGGHKKQFFGRLPVEEDKVELTYYQSPETEKWHLAFHVQIHKNPLHRSEVFIDAITQEIIFEYKSLCSHNHILTDGPATARATDRSGVERQINTYQIDDAYYLIDASREMFNSSASDIPDRAVGAIITLDLRNESPEDETSEYYYVGSSNNQWNGQEIAISAHYNSGVAYEYFRTVHGRNSLDGRGGTIYSVVNVADEDGNSFGNAYWNGAAMYYGNGDQAFDPLVLGLDVAGHEMAHGVIQNTANLEYLGEPGAINESYADIFGAMMDREDWLIGEEVVKSGAFPGGALRNMIDPHNGGSSLHDRGYQPAHYNERYQGTQDNGGVHINSGIGNRAYYLFASATSREIAERVYYRALTTYMSRRSNFADWRVAVLRSCRDLYNSSVEQAAAQAFTTVGIGDNTATTTNGGYADLGENPGDEFILYTEPNENYMNLYDVANTQLLRERFIEEGSLSKPSISDDGSWIFYINKENFISYVTIDWEAGTFQEPQNLTLVDNNNDPVKFDNVAVSKDGTRIALVTQDAQPYIYVVDLRSNGRGTKRFELYNPGTVDNARTADVKYADAIEFDHTGEFLVFDAFNESSFSIFNSNSQSYWNISLLNIWDNETDNFAEGNIIPLFASLPDDVSIGNPSFAKLSTGVIAFDYIDEGTESYQLYVVDLANNKVNFVLENNQLSYPSYSNDDGQLVFNASNSNSTPVVGLLSMNDDKITPLGNPIGLAEGSWGVWFANGQRTLVSAIDKQLEEVQIEMFPNPTTDVLRLNWEQSIDFSSFTVHDIQGKEFLSNSIDAQINELSLDLTLYPKGVYTISLQGPKKYAVKRIVKQ